MKKLLLLLPLILEACAAPARISAVETGMDKITLEKILGRTADKIEIKTDSAGNYTSETWEYSNYDKPLTVNTPYLRLIIQNNKLTDLTTAERPTAKPLLKRPSPASIPEQTASGSQPPQESPLLFPEAMLKVNQFMVKNKLNLAHLSVGMPKNEALNIMGTETLDLGDQIIANPYKISSIDDKIAVYYYTDIKKQDNQITDDELTPIIFENDTLSSIGHDAITNFTNRQEFSSNSTESK